MSRISPNVAADANAPAAISNLTITYTTDDPGTTANSAVTIADGDGTLVTAEIVEFIDEVEAKFNEILAALRTQGIIQS